MSLFSKKWLEDEDIIIRENKKEIVTKFEIYDVDGTDCGPREKGDHLLDYGWGYGAKIINKAKAKCRICRKWVHIGFPAFFLASRWDISEDHTGKLLKDPIEQEKRYYFHPDCIMKALAHMTGFIAILQKIENNPK